MRAFRRKARGSGLIVVLAVLAMLAIMATTFVTMTRLETRVTANYVDDLRCETLAQGMLSYFKGLLREASNRDFYRYNNRETPVGYYGYDPRGVSFVAYIGGIGCNRWGTFPSRAFWFYQPAPWKDDYSAMFGYPGDYSWYFYPQGTFSYASVNAANGDILDTATPGRYWYPPANDPQGRTYGGFEVESWISRVANAYDAGRGLVVNDGHPWSSGTINDGADNNYYDPAPLITSPGAGSKFFSGATFTGETTLPGGLSWRWAAKCGLPTTAYVDLNMAGNLEWAGNQTPYMGNMGNVGLTARRALDELHDWSPRSGTTCGSGGPCGAPPDSRTDHLGCIEWRGFAGEFNYAKANRDGLNGFPDNYNSVLWHPNQMGLEKLFLRGWYRTTAPVYGFRPALPIAPPSSTPTVAMVGREKARALIQVRSGRADGRPGDGSDRWRVGWRRDGASYYKLPNPDNPIGSEHYFGANELIEHDHSTYHGRTSAISNILGKADERAIRPYCSLYSADTILRGKIWPDEGYLPWRPGGTPGDWRHIDILKRVNLNIIGAKDQNSRPGDPIGDEDLKNKWALKAANERTRLYYMLTAAMRFTVTDPNPADVTRTLEQKRQRAACQFIASLIDMEDRDQDETYYAAPDGSGAWGLGVEKFPVINEVAFYCGRNASAATWELTSLRIELCNTAENIPWIPDADEAYDVSKYVLRITSSLASSPRTYELGTLRRYDAMVPDTDNGPVTTIGADGMYADPSDATHKTWSRLLHIGWPKVGMTWWPPDGFTQAEMRGRFTVQLWKPLVGDAQNNITADGVKVATILGGTQKYLRVDEAGPFYLVGPYAGWAGPGGTTQATYLGLYRRWDPMNAKPFGLPGFSSNFGSTATSAWVQGATLTSASLGKPNTYAGCPAAYRRWFERNFKVVDGDLPSIGWLGELMMWNVATDGPLTQIHATWQDPNAVWGANAQGIANQLDIKAKFDLFRPFIPVKNGPKYNPTGLEADPSNLHILDIFTVWDPSNDGIDNDGDGAIDDADTGLQPGDRGGPEVRVYGRLNLNHATDRTWSALLPHNEYMYDFANPNASWDVPYVAWTLRVGRQVPRPVPGAFRLEDCYCPQGPLETIGDVLRFDQWYALPGGIWAGFSSFYWSENPNERMGEHGFLHGETQNNVNGNIGMSGLWGADDDGDGISDERDERDMLYTWMSNFLTTRSNVFQIDLNVDLCEPPPYPGALPFKTAKTRRSYTRKQLLGILDRSTTLRIRPDRTCDFSGPVETRLLRFSDDLRVD